ncbi:hypothetical protein HOY80DRAFT_985585 [Tuber brumale]|nr:hypothetical protein HOY80DRAFT_985585 [Tuber brumale]
MSSGNSECSAGGSYRYEPPPPPPPPAPPHHHPLPGNRSFNGYSNAGSEQSPTTPSHRRGPSVFDRLQRGRASQPDSPISPLTQAPGAEQTSTRGSPFDGHTASTHDQPNSHAYPRRSSHGAHSPANVEKGIPLRVPRPRAGTYQGHKHAPPFQSVSQPNSQPTNMAPAPNPLHPLDQFWRDASTKRANSTSRASERKPRPACRKNSYPPPPTVEDAAESEESDLESRASSHQVPPRPLGEEKPPPSRRQSSSAKPPGADKPVGAGEKYGASVETHEKNETPPPEIHVREPRPYGSQGGPRPNAANEWTSSASPPLVRSDTEVSLPPQIPAREPRPYGSQLASQFGPGELPPNFRPKFERTDTDISLPPEIPAREPRPYGSQSLAQPTDRDNELDFVPNPLGRSDTGTSLPPEIPSRQPRPYGSQPQNAAAGNAPRLERTDTDISLPPELPGREPQPYATLKKRDTDISLPPELPGREPRPYSTIERSDTDNSLPPEVPSRRRRPYSTQGPGSAYDDEEPSTSDRSGSPLAIPTREPRPYSSQGSRTSEKTHLSGTRRSSTVPPGTPPSTNQDLSPQELARLPPCPKYNFTQWGTWFQLPFVLGFDICAHCYYTHIHKSQFGHYFSQAEKEHNVEKSCDFHTPRMQELWAVAIRTQSFEPVANYMERRIRIPNCKEDEAGVCDNWWGVPSEIPDFAVCEACYNDIVLASPFASRFIPLDPRPEDVETMCDLAVPGLKQRFLRLIDPECPTHGNTWKDFVRSATYRITEVPKCVGTSYVGGPRNWWTTKNPIRDFVICEACYLDKIELSPWRERFIPTPAKQPRSEKWSCDFTMAGIVLAWDVSLSDSVKNFDHFWHCADATTKLPPCESEVLDGAQWCKISGIDNFTVCPTCFYTVVVAANFGRHFYIDQYPPGVLASCDMGPGSPRHKRLLAKLAESLDLKDFSKFKEFAYTRSFFPPCPGDTGVMGQKWYGTDSFIVCEECYVDVVKPSSLASTLTIHGNLIEDSASCDIYSPRMKRIWAEACQMNDVGHFAAAAKHRAEVYFRVKPAMSQVRALLQMQRNMKGMYPPAPAAAGFNGYSYGNSVVGYGFESPQEVEAATMRKRANSTGVGDPALWQELFMLEQEWKAVE